MSVAWVGAGIAAVNVGVSASNSKKQASAAQSAASGYGDASNQAMGLQAAQYAQTQQMQAPWQNTGVSSLNKLSTLLGTSPSYAVNKELYRTGTNKKLVDVDLNNFNEQGYLEANPDVASSGWLTGEYTPGTAISHFKQSTANGDKRQEYIYDPQYDEAAYQQAVKDAEAKAAQDPTYGSLLKPFSMEDYQADPGYAFRLSEGQKGLERSAAARGGLYSGRAMKDMDAYSQGMASQEYGNAYNRYNTDQTNTFNRLATVAGYGQTANNQVQQAGSQYANNAGNIMTDNAANQGNALMSAANSQASSYSGIAKALGSVNWGGLTGKSGTSGGGTLSYDYPATYAQSQGQVYGPTQE